MSLAYIGLFAQQSGANGIVIAAVLLFELAVLGVMLAGLWKVFEKAGEPGWAAIVPIYNMIVLLRIAGKPAWWVVLYLLPIVSLVPTIIVAVEIAKNFNKSGAFAIGLLFLPFIFYPLLGFSDAQYGAPEQRGFAVIPPPPPF